MLNFLRYFTPLFCYSNYIVAMVVCFSSVFLLSQAQVDIHGTVVCKDACGSSVHVSLSRLLNDGKQEQKTIDLSHENSDFVFAKVLPGKYRLEVYYVTYVLFLHIQEWLISFIFIIITIYLITNDLARIWILFCYFSLYQCHINP